MHLSQQYKEGADVINKILVYWNKAQWFEFASHMSAFKQPGFNISGTL